MYSLSFESSSGDHGPFFTLALSQQGALPISVSFSGEKLALDLLDMIPKALRGTRSLHFINQSLLGLLLLLGLIIFICLFHLIMVDRETIEMGLDSVHWD